MTRLLSTAILAALALQLNVVRAIAPCEMTDVSHGGAPVSHADVSGHGGEHDAPDPAEHPAGCDEGMQAGCCVVSSCSSIAGSAGAAGVADRAPDAAVASLVSAAPLSQITTPDPPPPKA